MARLAGSVVDDRGAPVAGVQVAIVHRSQRDRSMVLVTWRGETDTNGRFEATGLQSGAYDVVVTRRRLTEDGERVEAHTGEVDVRVVIAAGVTVSARVLVGGVPASEVAVRLGRQPAYVLPSPDGRMVIRNVVLEEHELEVFALGGRRTPIAIATGSDLDLGDLELEPAPRVSGRVIDGAGLPIAGALVVIGASRFGGRTELERAYHGYYKATSDADGAFGFAGVDVPLPHLRRICAWHPNAGSSLIHELRDVATTIDLVLLGAGTIAGSVRGLGGGLASVLAERAGEPPHARHTWMERDATFRFDDVPPGDYTIRLDVPGEVACPTVSVVAGETVTVVLEVTSMHVVVVIRVPLGRGSDVRVEPVSAGAGMDRVRGIMRMGTEEHLTLHHVLPGDYRVSLDGRDTIVTIAPSPEEQTIDLRGP
jgi:hypothetical protein